MFKRDDMVELVSTERYADELEPGMTGTVIDVAEPANVVMVRWENGMERDHDLNEDVLKERE